ncbi:MAG TPA: PPC domain-containing protein, partial [Anaerolineales bacterium]|nr:PPC domain-containing protein [Anaerolineales bacterium]
IAVKAALFSAPAEISGSGESGSASFDVTFGYTGDYSAAAHGLVPAMVTSDSVVQDPGQVFDPGDGFSNLHQFTLSGEAYFRIAMPPGATPNPNTDIDIFVFDPDGNFFASSTSGGTDELIDIVLPMDGTWDVWIHGWSVPDDVTTYNLYTWAISATPGGNLNIDSAPALATSGSTETIDLSWTGATAGQWHLGAVSHSDGGGLLGLTLVNVDNR